MENNFDPFKLEEPTIIKEYSLKMRIMSMLLIFLFIAFPLYKISPDAFKLNEIFVPFNIME